jgi:hypothetical protein
MIDSVKYFAKVLLLCGIASLVACSLVDEDMRDCDADYQMDYTLELVTNVSTELETQFENVPLGTEIISALRSFLGNVFTDKAHDVDLSFYDVEGDSLRLFHQSLIMDASETNYTLYIPRRQYMHVALANLDKVGALKVEKGDTCKKATLEQPVRDTVDSHRTGMFTARLPMDIQQQGDQEFNVVLYMANCACALVLDTLGSGVKDVKVYTSGFATGMSVADSVYRFPYTPIVRTSQVKVSEDPQAPLCFVSVNFPSRSVPPKTKTVIETDDPFVSDVADEALWNYRVYATLEDGSITQTLIGVKVPLHPGQFKAVRANIVQDGSAVPLSSKSEMAVNVTLHWNPGMSWDVEL